ncbi:MAG: hypothetical protein JWR29_2179 [Tardiphaga sp.]|nr:hypothetical protein [Tardiphaga sp.]
MCDDDCPHCGARHMSPYDSENLTTIVVPKNNTFVVLLASGKAEHDPVYQPVAQFATHAEAEALKDALAS